MGWRKNQITGGENLSVCNDLHKKRWDLTIGTFDAKFFCARIPVDWSPLHRVWANLPAIIWWWPMKSDILIPVPAS